jgi:hypothetical protein
MTIGAEIRAVQAENKAIHRMFSFSSPYTVPMNSESETTHRVLMNFMDRNGWHVSFLEADCRTALPVKLTFATEDKIRDLHRRLGSHLLEDRQGLEHGLSIGRGSAWLTLTAEQYQRLKSRSGNGSC